MKRLILLSVAVLFVLTGTKAAEARSKVSCEFYGLSMYMIQNARNHAVPLASIQQKVQQIANVTDMPDTVRHYLMLAVDVIYAMPKKDPEQTQAAVYKGCMTKLDNGAQPWP